jgi:2-keto-4-pentenoate hydratase/2-oxohepta-3-ene-1,7-dioic acid hydratase in catechol pathway
MRFVTFSRDNVQYVGISQGEWIVDAAAAVEDGEKPLFRDMISVIRSGEIGLTAARRAIQNPTTSARIRKSEAELLAPMQPSTILCSGSNYRDHNAEKANTPISGKEPEFFIKTSDSVIGPGKPIIYDPQLSRKIDCETELAIVIGKPGRHIPKASALDHVFGYTIVNDVTARDRQVRKTPEGTVWYELGRGKAFDTSAPLGPAIVTPDEIGDPQSLDLKTRINGELRQASNTRNMIWTCADLIHFFSSSFTLRPGMVIITGTPSGTAWSMDKELGGVWGRQPGLVPATRYCEPGDVIESEIEKLGVLQNFVIHIDRMAPTAKEG